MKKQLFFTVFLLILLAAVSAQAAEIRSIYITGGGFVMGAPANPSSTNYNPFINVSGDRLSTGHPLNDDILMGSFQGDPGFGSNMLADRRTGIVGFVFGAFGNVAAYTSPDNVNEPSNPIYGIYDPPSGVLDTETGAYDINMESWTVGWGGNIFNQGHPSVTGVAAETGAHGGWDAVLNWSSLIVGGPFNGQTGYWRIEGEIFLVPEPGSLLLIGSGLASLLGLARRKQ